MRYLLITFLIIFVLGCVPCSDNPLTDPNKEQIDSSILGTWFWKDENESGYIHIGLDKESKLLRLMMLEFDRDGKLEASEFSGHTSSLGGNRYLNLKWVRPLQNEITGYMFVKYTVSPVSLGIAFMDNEVAEKAIKKGVLKGKVKKHKDNPLFGEDKPWEMRFDNLYANVIYDEQENIYKCWYSPFIIDVSSKGMTIQQRKEIEYEPPAREMAICYAISKDEEAKMNIQT